MKFNQNEEAVSPVIGVILMVAITVILAAVIAVFVFGMTGNMQTSHSVAVTAKMSDDSVIMTYQGGPDASIVDYIDFTGITSAGIVDIVETNFTSSLANVAGTSQWDDPQVGEFKTFSDIPNGGRMTVTAYFNDGTSQQVLNKQF